MKVDPVASKYLAKIGKKGGLSRSKVKVAAGRVNAAKATKAAAKAKRKYSRCLSYGSHRFSPKTQRCYGCKQSRSEVAL